MFPTPPLEKLEGLIMKIGMVLKNKFPPDIRVEKEVRSLLSSRHQLHLLAYRSGKADEHPEEEIEGLLVRRIPRERDQLPFSQRQLNSLRFFLTLTNRYWASHVERYVRDFELDVLHVHDLPLVGTALKVSQRLSIPLVADLHENYPASLRLSIEANPGSRSWFTPHPRRWVSYERRVVRSATHVVVVVDEAKERLIKDYGLEPEKITVVMNVEDVDYFKTLNLDQDILTRYKDSFVISYIGGGGKHRGLVTAIEAMPYLRGSIPQVKLVLVGIGREESDVYLRIVESQGVQDHVEIIGWQPFHKVPSYIEASHVGLVPHYQNPHTDATIPHKLFQYMLMSKPVVVSSCRPLKRIVEETKSGLVFHSGDPKDLARQIQILYANLQLRSDCALHGHEAATHQYNWTTEGAKLTRLYQSLSEQRRVECIRGAHLR
jgi:glycosyltransferase involved in cell wall biosynthesis